MNKVVYKDESKNIPGFSEALEGKKENFMWDILNLMDQLYKVMGFQNVKYNAIYRQKRQNFDFQSLRQKISEYF